MSKYVWKIQITFKRIIFLHFLFFDFYSIKIVLPAEGLENAVFEKNWVKHISFEVAKLRGEDKFGRTHTCYYQAKITSAIPTQDEAAEK